jgi:hypothetical protein
MSKRYDDPALGRDEVVKSVLRGLTRHFVLDHGNMSMTACRGSEVESSEVVPVKARKISCRYCKKYLNL